jgi:hypothetical protein
MYIANLPLGFLAELERFPSETLIQKLFKNPNRPPMILQNEEAMVPPDEHSPPSVTVVLVTNHSTLHNIRLQSLW